ncbi:hypothetical protein PSH54_03795 [Pseudoalteromonas sp. Angola-30]|uniref:hypothetical protein n=1 Tax=Pseudoalteromonas sp. Angola-30 TaxID=3025341 RepID=UPI0023598C54|nr:hypothetical protein [Pseudoalteromonas sp. Angola-30]MDC9524633.1 hypothetical protein [Pseudoalteromonas sp. Angola-30]
MTKLGSDSFRNFLLIFCIFILSLENHGNIRFILCIPPVIYFIFYAFYVNFNKATLTAYIKLFLFLILISVISYLGGLSYKENMKAYSLSDFFYATSFKLLIVYFAVNTLNNKKNNLVLILNKVLAIHVTLFFVQFILVYTSGYYLDFLEPFTAETSRYTWGVSVPVIGATYRPTGFFNEPSTYLSIVFSLLCVKYYFTGFLTKVDRLVILSLFLSLSFASIAIAVIFLVLINLKGKKIYRYLPPITVIILLIIPVVIDLYVMRTSGSYDALGIRYRLFDIAISQSWLEIMFGNGPVGVPDALSYLFRSDTISWTKEGVAAINDNGLAFFLFLKFGVIGIIAIIYCVFSRGQGMLRPLCLMLLFLTKIKFTSAVFIFILFLILITDREKSDGL